ncbi:MAG TPA: hypothetical protein PK156_02710 [Polyangium sp.]|nr:hypothetical protein [Polyangium sp.]
MFDHAQYVAVFLGLMMLAQGCVSPLRSLEASRPTASARVTTKDIPPEPVQPSLVETDPRPASPSEPEPASKALTLVERLDKRAVTEEHFARRELYSWTTPEQIAELRQTKTLLVATAKTHGAPSPYSRLLAKLAQGSSSGHELAKLLAEHPGLVKRRYAWPSPFATSVPLGERSYGHALIRVVLKDESLLLKLDPLQHEPFLAVNQKNEPVPIADVVEHPEHIGAVLHMRYKADGGPRFREYIICNEAMIARWSVGTVRERAIVAEEAQLIADLLQSPIVSMLTAEAKLEAATVWARIPDKPTLLDAWRAAVAFDSPKYKPEPKTLGTIAASLAAYDATGEPLDHQPGIVFPEKP